MKKYCSILPALLVVASFVLSCSSSAPAAGGQTTTSIATAIDSSDWTFIVDQVRAQEGMSRQPNGTYSVIYKPKKLNVYLPYFGRAYSGAEVFQGKSALDFVSTDFVVQTASKEAGQWRLVFKPNDQRQVQSMSFTVFSNGTASLDVIMTNRSPMSFSGRISPSRK